MLEFRPGLKPFRPLGLPGLTVTPVPLNHSKPTLGYCLDDGGSRLAYLTDTLGLPPETERFLRDWGPDVVVLDATHPAAHQAPRNHNNLPLALQIIERLGRRAPTSPISATTWMPNGWPGLRRCRQASASPMTAWL